MDELIVQDMVLRMAIDPVFKLNPNLLALHHQEVVNKKELMLAQAMMVGATDGKSALMSNEQFAVRSRKILG